MWWCHGGIARIADLADHLACVYKRPKMCRHTLQMRVVMKPPFGTEYVNDVATIARFIDAHNDPLSSGQDICAFGSKNVHALVYD